MNKWEIYVERITAISKSHGRCLGILRNVIVNDEEKLVMAQVRLHNSASLELFFETHPFHIDKHFSGYDIVITSNPSLEDEEDRESYIAYAYAVYTYMIANFKEQGGMDIIDANAFASTGCDLERVGISTRETYDITRDICDIVDFPIENITKIGKEILGNKKIDVGDIAKAFIIKLEGKDE